MLTAAKKLIMRKSIDYLLLPCSPKVVFERPVGIKHKMQSTNSGLGAPELADDSDMSASSEPAVVAASEVSKDDDGVPALGSYGYGGSSGKGSERPLKPHDADSALSESRAGHVQPVADSCAERTSRWSCSPASRRQQ